MLDKIIEFTLVHKELESVAEFPSPAIKNLPKWYKDMPSYEDNKKIYKGASVNLTMKKCVPVFDAISSGYIIKTWTDTYFEDEGVTWSIQESPLAAVEGHPASQIPGYPITSYYKKHAYKWANPWHIRTPKGYSTMFVTPIGHHLPFKIIEGVVDTDTFPLSINFPFFLMQGFSGVIPHGTPMVQLIPFKRDSFKSKLGFINKEKYQSEKNLHDRTFTNKYKINWWNRKEFK